MAQHTALDALFAPNTVAVIGASDKPSSIGRTVLRNLIDSPFGGTVYPIHPSQTQVLGIKAYAKVSDAPEPIDLAVIATAASTVLQIIQECVDANVKCAIIISAGLRESGEAGVKLEREILMIARGAAPPLRILGPNCLGIMRPHKGLNATFANTRARKGDIAFISQSGALGTAVLDWSIRENFGFSAFVSVGSMLDLGWGELVDFFGSDEHTRSIVLYTESISTALNDAAQSAREFLSAVRRVALDKPIMILKAGRTVQGARAAHLHTRARAESDAVLDAVFRRAGALRVETVADLFECAELLAKQARPKGPNLAILANAGGVGVLATDALIAHGGTLATFSDETIAQLDAVLPQSWSHANPVNMLGDASAKQYGSALEILSQDPNVNGILAILTPQATTDPTASAEALKSFAPSKNKPVLAAWMGGTEVEVGANVLRAANIPVFQYPDDAVRVFDLLWRYSENLRALYETPPCAPFEIAPAERAQVHTLIQAALDAGRVLLTEEESRIILSAYDIPYVETQLATTAAQASKISDTFGYPVVMKINTDNIIRKSAYGGVILNITSGNNVRATFRAVKNTVTKLLGKEKFQGVLIQPMLNLKAGYALHIGSMVDPHFGPVLRFGAEKRPAPADANGNLLTADATILFERDARYRDDALALPPLTTTLARRMIERTRVYTILREANFELAPLEQVLARFSALVVEQPRIKAIEIHPLMLLPPMGENARFRALALDARIILHDPALQNDDLPRPAIRPYPFVYVSSATLKDGTPVAVRPIRAEDEPLLVRFHENLSEQSVYLRYFHALNLSERIAHERLSRIAAIDYAREIALVVERVKTGEESARSPEGEREILAVARLTRRHATHDAEFAILIRDDCQRQGLGLALLMKLIEVARAEKIEKLIGEILPENEGMKRLAERAGFTLTYEIEDGVTRAELRL